MSTDTDALAELEAKVSQRWSKVAALRFSTWLVPDLQALEMNAWANDATPAADVPQFPREQWVTYPAKRAVALTLADRLMDFDPLTDEQWMTVCHLLLYGGRARMS